jgi:hypothetical protein
VLALATWSHIIFLPIPASPIFWAAALGFVCGLSPRLMAQVIAPPEQSAIAVSVQRDKLVHLLPVRLREWPGIFGGIVHGDLLYQRYAGEVRWRTPPVIALLGALALAWLVWRAVGRRHADGRAAGEVLLALAACFALTIVLSPESADRYQLMIAWFAPLALALLLESLGGRGIRRYLPPIAAALLVTFDATRTVVNLHAAGPHRQVHIGVSREPLRRGRRHADLRFANSWTCEPALTRRALITLAVTGRQSRLAITRAVAVQRACGASSRSHGLNGVVSCT